MNGISRRNFLGKTVTLGAAGMIAPSLFNLSSLQPQPRFRKNTIALAQWALMPEIRAGKWTNQDFPRIAREDFGIGAIEFVNTLWGVPTMGYLNRLKQNAEDHDVTIIGIACDAEGDACSPTLKERKQFAINHRKWIDAAQFLGCPAIRINCIGPRDVSTEEAMKWSVESLNMLLEYAIPANISVLVENHGGISNNIDFMISLIKEINSLHCAILPDWRNPDVDYDHVEFLRRSLPYSGGTTHYRNQPTEELTRKMIQIVLDSPFSGYIAIESGPREDIKKGQELLSKYI